MTKRDFAFSWIVFPIQIVAGVGAVMAVYYPTLSDRTGLALQGQLVLYGLLCLALGWLSRKHYFRWLGEKK